MPVKELPPELVLKLRNTYTHLEGNEKEAYRLLGRLKNIDPRNGPKAPSTNTNWYGYRVREMNVSRQFPGTELVLKRCHDFTAEETIKGILKRVRTHNKKYNPKNYSLTEPKVYPIGENIVAMSKIEGISFYDWSSMGGDGGDNFDIEYKTHILRKFEKEEITQKRISKASEEIRTNFESVDFDYDEGDIVANMIIYGRRGNKLLVVPAIDMY
ncbi:MAG: hypothetical protein V3U72_02210 [Candidatus Aenigmarchaeota archaeon]